MRTVKKPEERKAEMVEAAAKLFTVQGFVKTSVAEIVAAVDVAKESERGIVDLETLKKVNADLIATIEDTIKIQREGREARKNAEAELLNIEGQLKQALITASQR